eukprot:gene31680-39130_t
MDTSAKQSSLDPSVIHLYSFPSPEALSLATEEDLRVLGMGYRARYIVQTAQMVASKPGGGREWLEALRHVDGGDTPLQTSGVTIKTEGDSSSGHEQPVVIKIEQYYTTNTNITTVAVTETVADNRPGNKRKKIKTEDSVISTGIDSTVIKTEHHLSNSHTDASTILSSSQRLSVIKSLLEFPGVGPKVADCIALFSLDRSDTVPVDTHVWSIAARDYAPELLLTKSITPTVYESIGKVFRDRFGVRAGWAHSVLFAAELPDFRKYLPVGMQEEMKAFADSQRVANKERKVESEMNKKIRREIKEVSEDK